MLYFKLYATKIKKFFSHIPASFVVFTILGTITIYETVQTYRTAKRVDMLTIELASSTSALSLNIQNVSKNFSELSKETAGISTTLNNADKKIEAVKSQVGGVEQSVGSISGTVGNLQKLAGVDPQILKKYSKVYFMNENYVPAHLSIIPSEYVYNTDRTEQFITESWPHLYSLLNDAKDAGATLYIKSAYRSFVEQKSLKSSYSVTYGAGTANAFSADQGYSEHQLGTTIDFITTGLGGALFGFDTTKGYAWLINNAYRYGFVISYPKGNKYYMYEPWHWRYVGIKLATYLHDNNLFFYDMDQREIDKYLINTFDK